MLDSSFISLNQSSLTQLLTVVLVSLAEQSIETLAEEFFLEPVIGPLVIGKWAIGQLVLNAAVLNNPVNQAIFQSLLGREPIIPLRITPNLVHILTAVISQNLIQLFTGA